MDYRIERQLVLVSTRAVEFVSPERAETKTSCLVSAEFLLAIIVYFERDH